MSGLSIASYFPFTRVKVVSQNVHLDLQNPGTLIGMQPDRRYRPICRDCNSRGVVHSRMTSQLLTEDNTILESAQELFH